MHPPLPAPGAAMAHPLDCGGAGESSATAASVAGAFGARSIGFVEPLQSRSNDTGIAGSGSAPEIVTVSAPSCLPGASPMSVAVSGRHTAKTSNGVRDVWK